MSSRLTVVTKDRAQTTVEELYKDIERRIVASQPGLCPVELTVAFLKISIAQSCGKCVPCSVGLRRLEELMNKIVQGEGTMRDLKNMETLAKTIYLTADCAIGFEGARMALKGLRGFRDDFVHHIEHGGRCMDPQYQPVPCVSLCPANVDIPGYIALVHEGRNKDAVKLIRKDNPFPVVCGLICEHPCEARCRRTLVDAPLNIRGLKRYAVENEGTPDAPVCAEDTGKSVAIIGGGPSGLSAAYYLALMGHHVDVYEQRKQLGGMLRYGIPAYRLPREWLNRDIDYILSTGKIDIHTNVSIGNDVHIQEIKSSHDAMYISIGAHLGRNLGIEGEEAEGVQSAVEMLRAIGDEDIPDYTGEKIVVVGGGNVAMDVARSAIRCGAESVKIAYRRRKADMTAQEEEVDGAIADGCELLELHAPKKIEADENGKVTAILLQKQVVGAYKGGRPAPRDADTEVTRIPCDRVLIAVGQGIDSRKFVEEADVKVHRGAIDALDWTGVEGVEGVFAGGDCVTGPATVIRAIAGGKVAAANIDEYLGYHHEITVDVDIPQIRIDDRNACGRVNTTERGADERIHDFCLMEKGLSDEEAHQESSRCLRCDHFGYGSLIGGRKYRW